MSRQIRNAVCTFCGCVCDDIDLTVEENRIVKAARACALGQAWFLEHGRVEDLPPALIEGQKARYEDAIEQAIEILEKARYPLVFGLSNTTSEAQRQAVLVAELAGACIDTTTSVCHGPTEMALQGVGKVAGSLGEVKHRADLVIFWGANPAESHPRHFARYSLTPKGRYVPQGRKDRTLVVIDVRRTPSARVADHFIQIKPGQDFELINGLRALVKGKPVNWARLAATGATRDEIEWLVERMKSARYGALFFGMGLTMWAGRHLNSASIFQLAADLNAHTRFVAMPARGHGNVTGADTVLAWQTGYPFAVAFNRGYPRFNPGEFTAVDVLARGEADAALIIASDPAANFPAPARRHLASIPTIVLDPKINETSRLAKVHITTAPYGIGAPGTVYRMDEVPLRVRPAVEFPYPSDEEVLESIAQGLKEIAYATHT